MATPAFAFKADVSSEDDVAKMFEAVRDEFGTVTFWSQQRPASNRTRLSIR